MSRSILAPGEIPSELQERLARIDPRMQVRKLRSMNLDSVEGGNTSHPVTRWIVVLVWPEQDPRWQWVQQGTTSPENAVDTLCEIPVDCPLEQVPGLLANKLRRSPLAPRQLVDEVLAWNQDQSLRNGTAAELYGQEVIERVASARKRGKRLAEIPDPNADD